MFTYEFTGVWGEYILTKSEVTGFIQLRLIVFVLTKEASNDNLVLNLSNTTVQIPLLPVRFPHKLVSNRADCYIILLLRPLELMDNVPLQDLQTALRNCLHNTDFTLPSK